MKVVLVGATGAIGSTILNHCLRRPEITSIVTISRNPLPSSLCIPYSARLEETIIPDFGALEAVPDTTWAKMIDADALVWAMGTYDLNEDVNRKYPLAFQENLAKRLERGEKEERFRFVLLGGAFTEPDQERRLFVLEEQRRIKGLLQVETLAFAEARSGVWDAIVFRPGGILFGGNTLWNKVVESLFGTGLVIRSEELGACLADLVVAGSKEAVVGNLELVERGRRMLG
ncbi:hypothetical protein EJ02DRAFT_458619 [Clathrospora elynae]|uniref:NAD(P)-binding domain-containing protein n=1 Tax=Clathrospora elynae TaxID=706981 RepID=A0A6A5SCA5_9PLEO|nr:hypothetical protein EJ02DRAFT_458619 [Clathrospora elynae]